MRKILHGLLASASACSGIYTTSAGADEYFDWLQDRPETILFHGYRSQAEINADINATQPENRVDPPVYDSAQQAARWTLGASKGSIAIQDQLRPSFPSASTGNVLFVWEARWDAGFVGELGGLDTQKAFQLANNAGSGDNRRIELRTRFALASGSAIAQLDARGYIWEPDGQPLSGQINDFSIRGAKWTRFWAFVDFAGRTFSLWVADEDTAPVRLFNRREYTSMSGGLDGFWFEFNSSQERSGQPLSIWARNFAVLRNVSNVESLVSQGVPEPTIGPLPPSALTAR